jgi:hypothetical protein
MNSSARISWLSIVTIGTSTGTRTPSGLVISALYLRMTSWIRVACSFSSQKSGILMSGAGWPDGMCFRQDYDVERDGNALSLEIRTTRCPLSA